MALEKAHDALVDSSPAVLRRQRQERTEDMLVMILTDFKLGLLTDKVRCLLHVGLRMLTYESAHRWDDNAQHIMGLLQTREERFDHARFVETVHGRCVPTQCSRDLKKPARTCIAPL